ncbi:hypothetical protein IG631_09986 [Alternaria alternata]|nr:hypothetical protein IG631_09986 [Alternaria alternata]
MAASLMPSIVTHTAQVPFYDYFAHSFGHQLVRSSVIIRLLHSCLRTSHTPFECHSTATSSPLDVLKAAVIPSFFRDEPAGHPRHHSAIFLPALVLFELVFLDHLPPRWQLDELPGLVGLE